MRITIHRGNQIGGCITEIVSSMGTRIFVDLGHNLPKGDEESEDEFASEEAIADPIGDTRAIFYTHMHGDHVELFQYVPDGVDQYIGPLALNIMKAKYEHMSHAEALKENSDKCLRKLEPFKTYRKGRPLPSTTSRSRLSRSVIHRPIPTCSKSSATERQYCTPEISEGTVIWERASTKSLTNTILPDM